MAVLHRVLLALAGFVALTLPAQAAITFERIDIGNALVILIKGTFERSDDPEALIREVSATAARVVTFDSDGGNIVSAMAYGRAIRSLGLSTLQFRETRCVSACALAFVGGVIRRADAGVIGVHQASFSPDDTLDRHAAVAAIQEITAAIMTYLLEMGVDTRLLQLSLSVAPDDMRYLTAAEMEEYRVTSGRQDLVSGTLSTTTAAPAVETATRKEEEDPLTNDEKAFDFVFAYYEALSRGDAGTLAFMDRAYNEIVTFRGKPRSRNYVVDEKAKFITRWPVRAYNIKPGSVTVSCTASCSVTGVVDWYATREIAIDASSGSAYFLISWDPSTGKIASESEEVLDRDKNAQTPIRILSQWHDQNAICRETTGDADAVKAACTYRDVITAKLNGVGWCYGSGGQAENPDWSRCGATEEAQTSANERASRRADFPNPAQYVAMEPFTGRTRFPDFGGKDRKFKASRTRIRGGMRQGPNFAGHFTVVQIGCGAGCTVAIVGDNNSGTLVNFPRGGETHMSMQLHFKIGSRLVAAQWRDDDNRTCVVEFFDYDRRRWNLISKTELGAADACDRSVAENLR